MKTSYKQTYSKAKRQARKNKRKENLIVIGFSFLFISVMLIMAVAFANPTTDFSELNTKLYMVQQGDTLWSIGEKYAKGIDTRQWVSEVKKINNMESSAIYPRDQIIIYISDNSEN